MNESTKVELAVPEEAVGRGPIILGELRSEHHSFPSMLVQFSKVNPNSRKGYIHLYSTPAQSKKLFGEQGPFSFQGSLVSRDGVTEHWLATDIWLKSGSRITHKEADYWSQTSGRIGELEIREVFDSGPCQDTGAGLPVAWFVVGRCFLVQILATDVTRDAETEEPGGASRPALKVTLSDGASAEIQLYLRASRLGITRDTKKKGYAICVQNFSDARQVKTDVDGLLILASFASRERSVSWHWSRNVIKEESIRNWRFNFGKFAMRQDREDPLVPRDRILCHEFIQIAFNSYKSASHKSLLDAAIYALLAHDLTVELQIARLFSGIQGALVFALQEPRSAKRYRVADLFRSFVKKYPTDFSDLWPLVDSGMGVSLSQVRNSIVHGEAFSEDDFTALSYASQNLQWYLERIILLALGWDIQKSAVAPRVLGNYYAYRWQQEQQRLKI